MISMYNEETDKLITSIGQINMLNAIAVSTGKDINIVKDYYDFYKQYPKLSHINNDIKFKIFERKYKILKLLKNERYIS